MDSRAIEGGPGILCYGPCWSRYARSVLFRLNMDMDHSSFKAMQDLQHAAVVSEKLSTTLYFFT